MISPGAASLCPALGTDIPQSSAIGQRLLQGDKQCIFSACGLIARDSMQPRIGYGPVMPSFMLLLKEAFGQTAFFFNASSCRYSAPVPLGCIDWAMICMDPPASYTLTSPLKMILSPFFGVKPTLLFAEANITQLILDLASFKEKYQ
jgi:hypothetical protein